MRASVVVLIGVFMKAQQGRDKCPEVEYSVPKSVLNVVDRLLSDTSRARSNHKDDVANRTVRIQGRKAPQV